MNLEVGIFENFSVGEGGSHSPAVGCERLMLSRAPPRPEALCPSAQNASWLCDGCNTFHAACESRPRRVLGLLICPSCRSKSETEGGEGSSGLLAEGAAKRARTAVQRLGHNDSWGEGQASRWASSEQANALTVASGNGGGEAGLWAG